MISATRRWAAGALAASLLAGPPQEAKALAGPPDATSLAVQADAAHEAGRIPEAAELYTRAYRSMSPDEKTVLGEVLVVAALDDLRASFEASADAAFAATARALLEEYERDAGVSIPGAADHRAWIETAQAEEQPVITLDEEPPPLIAEARDEPAPKQDRGSGGRDRVGPALVGVGALVVLGGAVLVGVGAPLPGKAEQEREDAFNDPEFTRRDPNHPDVIAYVDGFDAYVDRETRRGRGLMAGGSVLIAAGVGVAIYGVVRWVRGRRKTLASTPIRPILGGVAF